MRPRLRPVTNGMAPGPARHLITPRETLDHVTTESGKPWLLTTRCHTIMQHVKRGVVASSIF